MNKRREGKCSIGIWIPVDFYSMALNDRIAVSMKRCDSCGKEHARLSECQFCHKAFCPDDYTKHMAWERRHEGLAEESSRLWRKKRR